MCVFRPAILVTVATAKAAAAAATAVKDTSVETTATKFVYYIVHIQINAHCWRNNELN
jgi:hypothetical protein